MLTIDADGFSALPKPVQAEGRVWLERAAPEYWTLRADVLDEGRVRIIGLRKGSPRHGDVFHPCACCGFACDHLEIVATAVYTNVQPPVALMAAMYRA